MEFGMVVDPAPPLFGFVTGVAGVVPGKGAGVPNGAGGGVGVAEGSGVGDGVTLGTGTLTWVVGCPEAV